VPKEEETLYAELDPGDCMYMVSSLYHAGSRNQTADQERYLYTAFYTKGYLRAEENQYLSYPLEAVKQYTPEQQELVSHQSSSPRQGLFGILPGCTKQRGPC
jgi:ectoine hydroxylase-related dioxygenase (phytanoyl-CoA dioxygenase family)